MTSAIPEIAHISLRGDRPENQDRYAILEEDACCLLVLGDGLGGHPRGDVAAQILVDTCRRMWERASKPLINPNYFLQQCALNAHQAIVDFGIHQTPPITPRTTAVLALLQEGECSWCHAGDSRFYLVRDEKVYLVSQDHTVANATLPKECGDQEYSPSAITRCLGGSAQGATPTVGTPIPLHEGDIVLLCSDGFWNQLDEEQMVTVLHNALPLSNALSILGDTARENRSGQSDNVTAVGVRLARGSYGMGTRFDALDEESELLAAIDHLTRLINKTL